MVAPRDLNPGEAFMHTFTAEIHKVIASTLPYVPGMEIVQAKPIIWGSVSQTFNTSKDQEMRNAVGELLQDAQSRF